jgi:drug/metabolite transporter (DMT)-like permease
VSMIQQLFPVPCTLMVAPLYHMIPPRNPVPKQYHPILQQRPLPLSSVWLYRRRHSYRRTTWNPLQSHESFTTTTTTTTETNNSSSHHENYLNEFCNVTSTTTNTSRVESRTTNTQPNSPEEEPIEQQEPSSSLYFPPNVIMNTTNTTNSLSWSIVLLNLVALLWGTQHAVIKGVVTTMDTTPAMVVAATDRATVPAVFTLVRFAIAAGIASPYTPALRFAPSSSSSPSVASVTAAATTTSNTGTIWRWGMELGLWMFLGFSLQAMGLQTTTAQRSGFLLYLNVKFVPFLAYLFYQRPIRTGTWISALTAFTGTALLAYQPNVVAVSETTSRTDVGVHILSLNSGDLWTIAAAVASAMFILRLEKASHDVSDAASLNAACLWVVTILALLWTILATTMTISFETAASLPIMHPTTFDETFRNVVLVVTSVGTETTNLVQHHGGELLYLGGVTTALANWIQTKAQRSISAERASIIYAMDPVYGAFFSYLILGETLNGISGWIGATLIVVAAATNAWVDNSNNKVNNSSNND